ncbi:GNAT family N-acetyltransferase [Mycolicibacterium sp. BiH015]|nr:GNAT family N-acetyltransferase [Mycolicibacterium sp. BiH015]MDA2890193.1 GNAT family N-acetyltransferase [Mycolicibacterium sp. BiH015]
MTLTDHRRVDTWVLTTATPHDHPLIADFLATTDGLSGRKFAADSRDVAEQLAGAYPGAVTVVRDGAGRVRGYASLNQPHGLQPEIVADVVLDPQSPPELADDVVDGLVARFARESASLPGSFLRAFVGDDQTFLIDALLRRGGVREGQFIRTRKPLDGEDPEELAAVALAGITVVGWPEVLSRGLGEQVRQVQYDTFLEHFGNMSKTPELWQHHIHSRSFAPDLSIAALDDSGAVVGYVLGSVYTVGTGVAEERSAHTDYIGVRRARPTSSRHRRIAPAQDLVGCAVAWTVRGLVGHRHQQPQQCPPPL